MNLFGSKAKKLEDEIKRLQGELDAVQKMAKTLASSNTDLSTTQQRLREEITQLQQMVRDSWGERDDVTAKLNAAQEKLIRMEGYEKQLLQELDEMRKEERRANAFAEELMINEENLANLIKKTKYYILAILRDLEQFMNSYHFLRVGEYYNYENEGLRKVLRVPEEIKRQWSEPL